MNYMFERESAKERNLNKIDQYTQFSETLRGHAKNRIHKLPIQPVVSPTKEGSIRFEFEGENGNVLQFEIFDHTVSVCKVMGDEEISYNLANSRDMNREVEQFNKQFGIRRGPEVEPKPLHKRTSKEKKDPREIRRLIKSNRRSKEAAVKKENQAKEQARKTQERREKKVKAMQIEGEKQGRLEDIRSMGRELGIYVTAVEVKNHYAPITRKPLRQIMDIAYIAEGRVDLMETLAPKIREKYGMAVHFRYRAATREVKENLLR